MNLGSEKKTEMYSIINNFSIILFIVNDYLPL